MPGRDPREVPFVKKPLDFGENLLENNELLNSYFDLGLSGSELENLHNSVVKRQPIIRKIAKDENLRNNMVVLGFLGSYSEVPNLFKINDIYKALVSYVKSKTNS